MDVSKPRRSKLSDCGGAFSDCGGASSQARRELSDCGGASNRADCIAHGLMKPSEDVAKNYEALTIEFSTVTKHPKGGGSP